MSNGPKTYRPCNACGKLCTLSMIDNLDAWTCWGRCSSTQTATPASRTDVTTAWERPCPRCGAEPSQPCRRDNGTLYTSTRNHHAERHATPARWK